MENFTFTAASLHKQRMHELMEEARVERFLNEKKQRDAIYWHNRRQDPLRKSK